MNSMMVKAMTIGVFLVMAGGAGAADKPVVLPSADFCGKEENSKNMWCLHKNVNTKQQLDRMQKLFKPQAGGALGTYAGVAGKTQPISSLRPKGAAMNDPQKYLKQARAAQRKHARAEAAARKKDWWRRFEGIGQGGSNLH